jgi:transposase-like protein
MRRALNIQLRIAKDRKIEDVEEPYGVLGDLDVMVPLIQTLIPLGFRAAEELLLREVTALAGPRYARHDGTPHRVRWGRQRGFIYLADQKLPLQVPRIRDRQTRTEVPLQTYARLQHPRAADEGVLRRLLYGLSCRDYRACADTVPEAFGLSRSSLSRRYIQATVRKLQALQERRLDGYDFVALVLDGKVFAEDTLVTALGLTVHGDKIILGFVQTGTENATACADFLRQLVARGLRYEDGLLVILDGSKGLRAGVAQVFGPETPVQRCAYHKRENILAYLPKSQQDLWRGKLERAYAQPTCAEATAAFDALRVELRQLNESALRSLDEGLDETLTLHRLGVGAALRKTLATTNMLESVFSLVEQRTGKVDRWRNSNQKHRWLAAALLDIEPRLRRVRGYRALPQLREALQQERAKGHCQRRRAVAS